MMRAQLATSGGSKGKPEEIKQAFLTEAVQASFSSGKWGCCPLSFCQTLPFPPTRFSSGSSSDASGSSSTSTNTSRGIAQAAAVLLLLTTYDRGRDTRPQLAGLD